MNLLKSFVLDSLENILNLAIANDPFTEQRLSQFAGKSIAFHTTDPNFDFNLQFYPKEIRVNHFQVEKADTTVSGRGVQLLQQIIGKNASSGPIGSDITIEGDAKLLEATQQLFAELQPELEEPLSRIVGDDIAFSMGQFVRDGLQLGKQLLQRGLDAGNQRIAEGQASLIGKPEMNTFRDDVKELRQETDRLEARIKQLQQAKEINQQKESE